jgi:hypothetical protein
MAKRALIVDDEPNIAATLEPFAGRDLPPWAGARLGS